LPAGAAAPERSAAPFTGSEIRLRDDAMPRAHIAVAYESVGWSSPDYYVFQVLQALIGSWSRASPASINSVSRLAELVATEGLADSFAAFHTAYNETGLFGIHWVGQNERTDDMACESLQELVRLAYDSTPTEIERAKNVVKASLLLSLDGTAQVSEEIGRQLIAIGRRVPPAETWARVDAISVADVQRVAKHFLADVDIAVAAIGPLGNLPEYNQLRSWTYQSRF
jgi:processing peptidase subunit beta